MSQKVADFVLARLRQWQVRRVFGVERPDDLADGWREALSGRPALLEVIVDPAVPPLPPHASLDQVEAMTAALVKGDPEALKVVTATMREKLQELAPGR